ncbi:MULTISPECIES: histidine kinase [Actinomadura]|uniref:histidine kinase n=2 Tax=Actinomadura yumaensis TaxID=111807 RepID=A0ABW2D372_9ACTN|nr:histidine kinase [Actinomadura sp. J1-007]
MSGGSEQTVPAGGPRGGEIAGPPGQGPARWPSVADFAVPAVLACAQLFGTWLLTSVASTPLGDRQWMGLTGCVIASCLALIWRRAAPGPVLAATVALSAVGLLIVQRTDTLAAGITDGVALYSLAVHRGGRTALAGGLAAFGVAFATALPLEQGLGDLLVNETVNVVFYLAITALGQLRRQYTERRRRIAEQLARTEHERRAAAGTERERLARDLHDVAGHHLSAVVVHSGAVARLDDPDLTARALTAAADTGRDVLKALSRLVDVMGPESEDGDLDTMLPALCEGLARVGVPVSLAIEGAPAGPRRPLPLGRAKPLRPELRTAAYRIVQESLTNAMRYASGAPVAVEVARVPGAVEITVANEAPPEADPVPSLGTGRGIAGMRERAESVGGTLTAGPSETGGWTVRAVLPTSPAGPRRGPGWPEVLDGSVVLLCAALPPILAFTPPEPILRDWSLGGAVLVVAALLLRAVPLWWRRRAPWTSLGALLAIDVVWACTTSVYSPALVGLLAVGAMAEMVAVYSVAGHSRPGRFTWPAPFVAVLPWTLAWTILISTDSDSAGGNAIVPFGLLTGGMFGALVLLPFWAWGRAVTGRGQRWEAAALRTMAARAGEAALAERHRVALGLRGTVLDHTARLVRTAEAGLAGTPDDAKAALAEITGQARAALLDMRALLDALEEP